MTKKERLGSDPFKESSLDWIQDTREEKKEPKEIKKQKPEEVKPKNVKTSFYILIDRRKENAFRSQWN
jgi:hypothetical protein